LEYALALIVLLALVAIVVIRPLTRDPTADEERYDARRSELEAAKEAKYREIRDAELDHEMGKLSDDDFRAVDRELRGEAIAILRDIDRLP
jgi:flagellar biosynthesis/type III secretory pathway M-ring protein FliF/YscJ